METRADCAREHSRRAGACVLLTHARGNLADTGSVKCELRSFAGRKALRHGVRFKQAQKQSDALAGEIVVFTGDLESMTRDQAKALVLEHGGKAAGGISKKVTMVVAGPGAGAKLDNARELGIRVLDEGAFLKLLGK